MYGISRYVGFGDLGYEDRDSMDVGVEGIRVFLLVKCSVSYNTE